MRPERRAKRGGFSAPSFGSRGRREGFSAPIYIAFAAITMLTLLLSVSAGSVAVPPGETFSIIWRAVAGREQLEGSAATIILAVRLPRVLSVALTGSALSLCGAAMQGLLKNPLADGSTLGVSAGASLGAALAIAFGITVPLLPFAGAVAMAMLFAFLSLLIILALAYRMDYSLATNTIILIGVIYSMFVSSLLSLIITFAPERLKHITFWTMGSLAGSSYRDALLLLAALLVFGGMIGRYARELNAFAIGEDNARSVGVDVRRVKLAVLVSVSVLIGVCVSIGGTIGFVGLVTPHMTRMVVGPNHKRLLPACLFSGAIFLMLADLVARVLLSPRELPIGVVTSFVGALLFIYIFYRSRGARA